jgi:hypothetical protein
MDDQVNKDDLCSFLLNVLLLKAQHPGYVPWEHV